MAESLLVGAAVGAAFGELLNAVLEMKHKFMMFKQALGYLQTTLIAIAPVIKEIEQHNNDLDRPKEELESLIKEMEQGTKLVYKCSRIRKLNFPARIRYQEQLAELVESLVRFFMVNMQAQTSRDVKETLLKVRRIHSAVNKPSRLSLATGSSSETETVGELEALESKSTQLAMDTTVWTNSAEQPIMEDIDNLSNKIREEPYPSPIMKRYESYENTLIAGNGSQTFGSQDDEQVSFGNSHFGIALYNFTAEGDDELSLTAGEEPEIEYEVDFWFYVKKKCPGSDGKISGLVPVLYVNQS